MEWIKRNILFVAGSAVALVLMGLAAYYLVSGSRKNDAALEQLNAEYALLERLNTQNPHPGDEQTDNIAAARKERKEVDDFIAKMATVFEPINPIPDSTNLNNAMFAGALRRTISRLQAEAAKGGVDVPSNFYFSFTAVRDLIMFDRAGLQPLATQLGDVKAICDVLIDARVNAVDAVRRTRVSKHDYEAQQVADYIMDPAVTNEIAILSPYEVSFRCFSSELAEVLAGYAASPHGLIVRAINVEPAALSGGMMPGMDGPGGYYPDNPYGAPGAQYMPPMDPVAAGGRRARAMIPGEVDMGNPYGAAANMGGAANPYGGYPGANPYAPAGRGYVSARGGLPTMLDERQIKVTMLVQVVRLTLRK